MARSKNKNIQILKITDLKNEVLFDDFEYKDKFHLLCRLNPNRNQERLDIVGDENEIKREGLVYAMVINGFLFKIGHTITSIKKRVQSYNCGKQEYRINGTCSTTNYFVLQSILKMNVPVEVYALFSKHPTYSVLGQTFNDGYPPSKRAEKIILTDFIKRHKKKPIGCSQT